MKDADDSSERLCWVADEYVVERVLWLWWVGRVWVKHEGGKGLT